MVSTDFGSMPAAAMLARHGAGGRRELPAGAGVEQDELGAGIDQQGRERDRDCVGRQELIRQRLLNIGERCVFDEFVVERPDTRCRH